VVRLRCDRVVYGAAEPYAGQGRPGVHGRGLPSKTPKPGDHPPRRSALKTNVTVRCGYATGTTCTLSRMLTPCSA
jgi:hypothetical protein